MSTRTNMSGFTLVELVIVIAIVGILAAVALPKFINLSSNAQTNTTTAVAGSLASAAANNYAARKLVSTNGVAITNCQNVANALQTTLPTGYTIASLAIAADVTAACTLNGPSSTSASFNATGIP